MAAHARVISAHRKGRQEESLGNNALGHRSLQDWDSAQMQKMNSDPILAQPIGYSIDWSFDWLLGGIHEGRFLAGRAKFKKDGSLKKAQDKVSEVTPETIRGRSNDQHLSY
jgi:hypothetical protein